MNPVKWGSPFTYSAHWDNLPIQWSPWSPNQWVKLLNSLHDGIFQKAYYVWYSFFFLDLVYLVMAATKSSWMLSPLDVWCSGLIESISLFDFIVIESTYVMCMSYVCSKRRLKPFLNVSCKFHQYFLLNIFSRSLWSYTILIWS